MKFPKEDFCKHEKLVTGNEATVHLVERDCKFAMFWPPDLVIHHFTIPVTTKVSTARWTGLFTTMP